MKGESAMEWKEWVSAIAQVIWGIFVLWYFYRLARRQCDILDILGKLQKGQEKLSKRLDDLYHPVEEVIEDGSDAGPGD
jgi:hypothetical protein